MLRIDSLVATYYPKSGINVTSSEIKVRYLVSANNQVYSPLVANARATALKANLDHNNITLFGSFNRGEDYEVTLCNYLGQKVFNKSFIAADDHQKFNLSDELIPGVYIVNLIQKSAPSSHQTVMVVK